MQRCFVIALLGLAACVRAAPGHEERIAELVAAGEVVAAWQHARGWAEQAPDSRAAPVACGDLAVRCGAFDEAVDCYETALFMGETAEVAVRLGDALLELGREDEALHVYRRALELDDRFAPAHVGIGRVHAADADRRFEARLSLTTGLQLDPDSPDALTAIAELDLLEGVSGAFQALGAVVERFPDFARVRLVLGRLLARWGQAVAARAHWREYVRLEPARPETWLLENGLLPVAETPLAIRGSFFVFSPDGTAIAYSGAGATARQQILTVPADDPQVPHVVCEVDETPSGLSWSPDGGRIAFRTLKQVEDAARRQWEYSLYTVAAEGGEPRRIYVGSYIGVPAWTPDGKRLCFDTVVSRRGRLIAVLDDMPEAEPEPLITPPRGYTFQSIMLGRETGAVITTALRTTPQRDWNLLLYPPGDLTTPQTLHVTPGDLLYPVFTPDERTVLFLERTAQRRHDICALPVSDEPPRPRVMLRGAYFAACPPSVSADGRRMLVYAQGGVALVTLAGLED